MRWRRGRHLEFGWMKATMAGLLLAFIGLSILFNSGLEDIFGISLGGGWRAGDRGEFVYVALTPRIAYLDSDIFLAEGEELVAEYATDLEEGRVALIITGTGWVHFPGDPIDFLHTAANIRGRSRREVRVTAPRSGFYEVSANMYHAVGGLGVRWHVERAQTLGRVMRGASFAYSIFGWLILIAIGGVAAYALVRKFAA